jgi:hypothetical protein
MEFKSFLKKMMQDFKSLYEIDNKILITSSQFGVYKLSSI